MVKIYSSYIAISPQYAKFQHDGQPKATVSWPETMHTRDDTINMKINYL